VINYGSLNPNTTAAAYTSDITVYTTGNIIVNALIKGSPMGGPGADIPASNQHFGTSTYSANLTLSGTDQLLLLGQTVKPTAHAPTSNVSTVVHWATDVPNAQTPGGYSGTNTSTVVSAI
jgi:hypothetical protein